MKIESTYFGALDISEDAIVNFVEPIPGFSELKRFVYVFEIGDEKTLSMDFSGAGNVMFCWLQSLEMPNIAFALMDVFKIKSDYTPEIEETYLKLLDYSEGDIVLVYNIVNIPENIRDMTVNLMAPIVLNANKMKAMQVLLKNDAYGLRYKIFEELKNSDEEVK